MPVKTGQNKHWGGYFMRLNFKRSLLGVSLLALSVPAFAQTAPADDEQAPEDEKLIVVTGTLIRGIAPPGASTITVNSAAIAETGASTTAQLLEKIPQLGSFNDFQAPVGASSFVTTNRPNLRNLPGFTTAGSSPTLVLVDGHRVVGAGISVTTPDPDIVPPGAIERVEIVPDGGSAIYGSDAVAGVINFITRKRFDGVEVGGHFGFADNYKSWDVNATVGRDWGSGSIFVSYNYSQHDGLLGRDRDWVFYPNTTIDGVTATSFLCSPGNVTVGNTLPFGPQAGAVFGTFGLTAAGARQSATNQCDDSDNASIYPEEQRHSVLAGLTQELSENLTFDLKAFYTQRAIQFQGGQFNATTRFGPSFLASFGFLSSPIFNANLAATGGFFATFGETQTVYSAWGASDANHSTNDLSTWGVAPSFTLKLGNNFQLRSISSYGESSTRFAGTQVDSASLINATRAGLFNPYNVSASNPVALAAVSNFINFGHTRQRQFNTRLIIDGDLFRLPGGAVKLATGVEYDSEAYIYRAGGIIPGTENTGFGGLSVSGTTIVAPYSALPITTITRNVKSVFGELVIPLFGPDNATAMFQELSISVAGRYDDYSDFGSTTNPKFGITWKPFDALKLRGSWGQSFVAPSLADDGRVGVTRVATTSLPFLQPTAAQVGTTINGVVVPAVAGRQQVVLLGNKPGITSQTAKTWSVGADLDVPFIPGLRLSATYYNIDYKGIIAFPPFTTSTFYANFVGTPAIQFQPSAADVAALALLPNARLEGPSCGGNCYVIIDARKQNLSSIKIGGLDFVAQYVRETGFGSVDFAFNGNYDLTRDQQAASTTAFVDQIDNNASRFRFRTSLGANIGNFRAQASLNHSAGYDLLPAVGVGTSQTKVKSFNVVDLFFKYDIEADGALNGTSFTLNVNNVFDQDPPVYLLQNSLVPGTNGFANGRTLGRFVQFGISKKF
jgi:iron complex outermembrane recepter protein